MNADARASGQNLEVQPRDSVRAARSRKRALAVMTMPAQGTTWRRLQVFSLAALVIVAFLLLAYPKPALLIFWNAVVPVLPLSFLLAPGVWRSICPLATLNMMGAGIGTRRLSPIVSRATGAPSIALLAALVPARHFALNAQAASLVSLLVLCAVVAAVCGVVHDAKAGFCNAICPLLPVERLYGQRPLFHVGNPRCAPCTLCTPRGCLDLAPSKSIMQVLGPARRSMLWLTSAFGVFATGFPGFIVGYFQAADTTPAHALEVYGIILLGAALSWAAVNLAVRTLRIPSSVALPALAACSAGAYYWYATPRSLDALGAAPVVGLSLRWVLVAGVAVWGMFAVAPAITRRTPVA
ncbi:MAG: hypothetical protein U0132_09175 [Gemmatimonadaceae bacterium]